MISVRKTMAIIAVLGMIALLAGCNSNDSNTSLDLVDPAETIYNETNENKEVIIYQGTNISSLDMHKATGTTTASVCFNMYDSLTRADANGVVQPLLAKSWENIDDYTWQFKLEEDIKFHNGEEFNAETVKFNVERILNPEFNSILRGDFSRIDRIDVVDEYTVNIVTKDIFPSLPLRITYLAMEPAKYIQDVGDEQFALKPIGTGPYKFVEMVSGSHVILERNDEYWNSKPVIERLTFKIVPEESTRMLALETGEADIVIGIPPSQVARINSKDEVTAIYKEANRIIYLGLNQIPEDSPMKDINVRQALNYGINREEIISVILEGIGGTPVATLSLPQWTGYDSSIEPYPYDPDKAKSLLSDAGYANGLELSLSVVPGAFPANKEIAEAIAGQLSKIGVNCTVVTNEALAQRELIASKKIDLLHLSGLGGPYAENSQTLRILLCSGERFSVTDSPEFDAKFAAASSIMDPKEASTAWSEIQQITKEQALAVPLYQLNSIYGINKRIDWVPRLDEIVLGIEMGLK